VTYTAAALLGVAAAVAVDLAVLRTRLLCRRVWWVCYAIVLGFQLLTNGVLTGRRIVVYDPEAILGGATPSLFGGWRIAYAPVEDLAFGFAMVLLTLSTWVWLGRRGVQREPAAGTRERTPPEPTRPGPGRGRRPPPS
jgi:lycopene cyclase domain-containing protein